MNCGDMGPLLSAYYDGEATAEERKFVEDCLESSPEAIAQLSEYRRITGEFEALPRPTPPADLRRSVMNQVHKISSTNAARYASATTERYRSVERSATGSVQRPVTVATVLGQGLKLGALLAVLVALLIAFTLVFNQFNRNQPGTIVGMGGTQTAVAMLSGTNTPTPQPSNTPVVLETSTPALVPGVPTNAPAAPTNTPNSSGTVVAQGGPTDTSAPSPPTDTTAPLPPTHVAAVPRSTNTTAPAPATDTIAPARPTNSVALGTKPSATPTALTTQATDTPVPPTSTATLPSATPEPPTATPDLTATPLPSPTPICAITPVRGFGKLYNEHTEVQAAMGCATDTEQAITGTILPFQNGTMIWDSQHRLIYVFYNNRNGRTFEVYPENWNQGDGEPTPVVSPPNGFYTPLRGFGKVWFNHQMWATLGFAKQPNETPISEADENFQGGRMLWTDQKLIYVMSGKPIPTSDANAVQFSGNWNVYRDTFVDAQPTPTPVASTPNGNVTTSNPPPDIKRTQQQ